MLERREARFVRDLPAAQDRVEVDEWKAVVSAGVVERVAEAGGDGGVADAAKERIFKIKEAVAHALREAIFPMATPLELDQFS
jgi:hypothetical protein